MAIDLEYDGISGVYGNMALATRREEMTAQPRMGIIEMGTNRQAIPFEHDRIDILGNNLFAVSQANIWGAIDASGNEIMPVNYNSRDVRAITTLMNSPVDNSRHRATPRRVHWFEELKATLGTQEMEILCLETGRVARARSIANGNHADIMGTTDGYQTMLASFRNVLVYVNWDVMAASMNRFAPSIHFCLHFYGSTQNNNNMSWGNSHIEFGERVAALMERYLID